jgi:hypothetical protein
VSVDETDTVTTYTFTVADQDCDSDGACCGMDLHKIEFHMQDACRESVVSPSVAINEGGGDFTTVPKSVQFLSYGASKQVRSARVNGL